MKFKSVTDKFEIAPSLFFDGVSNRSLDKDEMFYLVVSGMSQAEIDQIEKENSLDLSRYEPAKRIDEQNKRLYDKVKAKVHSIHNYTLPSGDVTDFDELMKHAGPELVKWLYSVLVSLESLSRAERKNFLPPPVSP